MNSNKEATKWDIALVLLGSIQILLGVGVLSFSAMVYFSTTYDPDQLEAVTKEMYAQLFSIYSLAAFQFIPLLAFVLVFAGISVLICRMRLRGLVDAGRT